MAIECSSNVCVIQSSVIFQVRFSSNCQTVMTEVESKEKPDHRIRKFLTNMQLFTSQDVNWWTGVVWITCGLLMFLISCLDSHSDGTHSLQRIYWLASDGMLRFQWKKRTQLILILGSIPLILQNMIEELFIFTFNVSSLCTVVLLFHWLFNYLPIK